MQDSSTHRIKKFTTRASLAREISSQPTQEYTYHHYQAQNVASQQMKLVEDTPSEPHSSRAADETAILQAKINAEIKKQPLNFYNPGQGTISQTAFLQHQIDLRRR